MMFWHVMSMKLNIAKKIAGLEIMTLNCENMYYVSNLLELMSKGKLHCLKGCFRKLVNAKHEDRLKNFLKYFFLLFKQS